MDTLRTLCERLYFRLNLRIRSEKTRKHYRFALDNLARVLHREPTAKDLTDDNIVAVMADLLHRGRSERTANERRDRLNALWKFLTSRGLAKHLPTNMRLAEPERTPVAWRAHELSRILEACELEKVLIDGVRSSDWWTSLHLVMWSSSERIGALMLCEWDHFSAPWLSVPFANRKGRRASREYRLKDEAVESLERIRNPRRKHIWPWPYCFAYLWNRYRIIRRRAGLPTDRYSSFHRMRKSSASHYKAAGGNAQELLGHSSPKQTRRYLDPRVTGDNQAADLLFDMTRPTDLDPPKGYRAS